MSEIFAGRVPGIPGLLLSLLCLVFAAGACDRTQGDVKEVRAVKEGDAELAGVKIDGKFLSAVRWNDAKGKNVLVITEPKEDSSKDSAAAPVQGLHARHFVLDEKSSGMVWEYRVKAENMCDRGAGLVAPPEVADVNADGLADVIFVYNVQGTCDVSPKEYGLVMESRGQTFSILGKDSLAVNSGAAGNGEKHLSEEFKSGDPKLRSYALEVWERLVPRGK